MSTNISVQSALTSYTEYDYNGMIGILFLFHCATWDCVALYVHCTVLPGTETLSNCWYQTGYFWANNCIHS